MGEHATGSVRSHWGWGVEGGGPDAAQSGRIAKRVMDLFSVSLARQEAMPASALRLREPRVAVPDALASIASQGAVDRARHHYGRSYRDVVRGHRGEFPTPPDWVLRPGDENEVVDILDWCSRSRIAAIPYGGGSSVVGGVETGIEGDFVGVVSIDLERLNRVVEIDRVSRAARIQAGAYGPALEAQLRPEGLTLRHFPQSFEFSTLGGWLATRAGGHFATLYTHIDDLVESMRVVTPTGTLESRRLPGSGAGPSPDRMFLGSEGSLGIITEAWMRLQDRPTQRGGTSVLFRGDRPFLDGAQAVRALSQSGLYPSNCRLLDPVEALTAHAGSGAEAVLVLAFESADHPVDPWMDRALEICRDHGGEVPESTGAPKAGAGDREGAAGAWRDAFLKAPYLRNALVEWGVMIDTFETAIPWSDFEDFYAGVHEATTEALHRVCGGGVVGCRFTHVYPDGAAPYFSFLGPAKRGSELEQWAEVKSAASEAILRLGGTITHHHAVGRDHRPWYDRQRPDGFARALRAAKRELDPAAILNPGVLFDA